MTIKRYNSYLLYFVFHQQFLWKKNVLEGGKLSKYVSLIFIFFFFNKTGLFSIIISDLNSNRHIWNFLSYLEIIFSSEVFNIFVDN